MSKPGGKPIAKKRPFFEDEFFAVYVHTHEEVITSFQFTDKSKKKDWRFEVKNGNILEAFKKFEEHADTYTHALLVKVNAKIKGPYPLNRKPTPRKKKV